MSVKANQDPRTKKALLEEIGQLRTRLDEAEQDRLMVHVYCLREHAAIGASAVCLRRPGRGCGCCAGARL